MAERRMFAKSIVLSDAFLDMPMSARCLYFTLSMVADDDGFVGSPKAIMRQCGASQDDMAVLLQKRFILGFESGVIVIKHWRMNNYLQNDRHNPTTYIEELSMLTLDKKKAYTEGSGNGCIRDVYETDTNCIHSIGKDSIDKNSISSPYVEDIGVRGGAPARVREEKAGEDMPAEVAVALKSFEEMRKRIKKPLTCNAKERLLKKLNDLSQDPAEQAAILHQSEDHCWLDVFPLKSEPPSRKPDAEKATPTSSFNVDEAFEAALRKSYGEDFDRLGLGEVVGK